MKKKMAILITGILAFALFTGCASNSKPSQSEVVKTSAQSEQKSSVIKVAGSTSVAPLMKELKSAYEKENAGATVEIQENGSTAGITATIEGAAQLGMSSRDLKQDEKDKGLIDTVIALDGIAVIVNPENNVSDLTKDQILAIFKGEITNWKEVGGNDGEIIVVSREEGSGTRGAFEELLKLEREVEKEGKKTKESLLSQDALFENSTGAVQTSVSGSKNAIGYTSLGAMNETVKALSVDGVAATEENILNKTYSIARPFIVCTNGEPDVNVKAFIDFVLSDKGQAVVSEHKYIKVK